MSTNIVKGTAVQVLAAAYAAGRPVLFWLDVGNQITGVFQAKNGKAVGVSTRSVWEGREHSAVYYAMERSFRTSMIATVEEMKAYRERHIQYELDDSEQTYNN